MVDTDGFKGIDAAARMTKEKVETGQWRAATQYWAYTQNAVFQKTYNIDFYNILTKTSHSGLYHLPEQDVLSFDGGIQSHTHPRLITIKLR